MKGPGLKKVKECEKAALFYPYLCLIDLVVDGHYHEYPPRPRPQRELPLRVDPVDADRDAAVIAGPVGLANAGGGRMLQPRAGFETGDALKKSFVSQGISIKF